MGFFSQFINLLFQGDALKLYLDGKIRFQSLAYLFYAMLHNRLLMLISPKEQKLYVFLSKVIKGIMQI
jgi:hypothetical protein